jgi:site-specific DNA recombinase
MATIGYIRVSRLEQTLGGSLADQERLVRAATRMRGSELDDLIVENGVTGSIPLEARPAGKRLCKILATGNTLVVAKLDRAFGRAADALTRVDEWHRQGTKLVVADMGSDPVTDGGVAKMFFGMLALVAKFERDRILERTPEGRAAKIRRGGHAVGSAPLGESSDFGGRCLLGVSPSC